jgi:hypothetical protein
MVEEKTVQELTKSINILNSSAQSIIKSKANLFPSAQTAQTQNPTTTEGTSRFVKKVDTSESFYKRSLGSMRELINIEKTKQRDWGKGASGLGKLLALGGLIGYLLTGKQELLGAVIKGFEKAFVLPIVKVFDVVLMKVAGSLLKYLPKVGGKVASVGSKVVSGGAKILEKVGVIGAKKVTEKVGAKVIEEGAEVVAKGAGKSLIKIGGKLGIKGLAKIPILGTILGPIVGIKFAMDRWKKGDKFGALGELASGLATMIPGAGTFISLGIDALLAVRDVLGKAPEQKNQFSDASPSGTKMAGDFINRSKRKPKNAGGFVGKLTGGWSMFPTDFDAGVNPSNDVYMRGMSPFALADRYVDVADLNSDVRSNLEGMASDYFAMTGKKLPIDSAFRSHDQQVKLYNDALLTGDPNKIAMVAKPGNSRHEFGRAVDIRSDNANELERLGLLKKWKFERPLMNPSKKPFEPWHVEPIGNRQQGDNVQQAEIINTDAIKKNDFMSTLMKIQTNDKGGVDLQVLIEATRENGFMIKKAIEGIKMNNRQTVSVSSAG